MKQVSEWTQNVGNVERNVNTEVGVLRKDWRGLEGKLTLADVKESREGVGKHQKSWEIHLSGLPRPNTQGDPEVRRIIKADGSCFKVHKCLWKLFAHVWTFVLKGKKDWREQLTAEWLKLNNLMYLNVLLLPSGRVMHNIFS
ncbi:MAG: hypothetical protein ACTS44_00460 [Candidatus Hodgkinia cicadicola]